MKAKRGDIAVIVREERTVYIGRPSTTSTRVDVVEVAGISRDGLVKRVRPVWDESDPIDLERNYPRRSALYVVPRTDVDVPAALAAARAHTFPNSTTPMPYGSVAEVKAMLSAHRTSVSA